MSAHSAVTYTSVHSGASFFPLEIPSEDSTRRLPDSCWRRTPRSLEPSLSLYVPDPIEMEDHVPVYIPEPEHLEDLVPAEDEAPTPPLPPSFLSLRIRPPCTRATMAQMRATTPSTYHPLLPSGTPPLLPIPLPAPSTAACAMFLGLTRRLGRGYYLLLLDLVVRLGRVLLLLLRDSHDPLWPIELITVL
ncbi:hypothetical protein Tco_1570915 [Tanacetum coccineum]